jgi:outer membrane protein
MRKIILTFVFALAATAAGAQQLRLTLDQCLDYAMGNSHARERIVLDQRAAELALEQARMDRLPNLSGSVGESLSHSKGSETTIGGSYGLSTGVTLWQGGAMNETVRRNEMLVGRAGVRTEQWDNTLAIDIMSSYFTILGYEELLRYQESLIAAGEEQVREGTARLEQQDMIPSDYLMLEAQLAQNRNNIAETLINRRNEMLNLKGLLSMEADADLTLAAVDTTAFERLSGLPPEREFMELAEAAMPDMELLDYGVGLAQSDLKIARAGFMPSLSLSGGLSTGHSRNFENWGDQVADRFSQSAGVSLSVPIFNRGRTRNTVERSRIALRQAELDKLQGEIDLRARLLESYLSAQSALERYRTLLVRESAYRQSLAAYQALYQQGTITAVDMLQQENNYINVMYEFVQGKYGFILQRKMLDIYMGLR